MNRSCRRQRRLALRRAWLWLGLVVTVQVGAFLHLVTVAHGTCSEHPGELVHGAAHDERAHAAEGPAVSSLSTSEAEAHDDHCGLASCLRPGVSVGGESARGGLLATGFFERELDEGRQPEPGSSLYLLAPKASPPARG